MPEPIAAHADLPEEQRIAPGSVVRVTRDLCDEDFDAIHGHEYLVDAYVAKDAGDADPPQPYYMLEAVPGSGSYGEWFAPTDAVEVVRSAEEQAALMRLPTGRELMDLLSDGLHQASGDLEVFESRIIDKPNTGEDEPFEPASDFIYGVEFYGRRRGGMSFGATVRLTAFWRTDD